MLGRQSELSEPPGGRQNRREQLPNFLINFPGLSFCSCPTLEKRTPKAFDVAAALPFLRRGMQSEHPGPVEKGCPISLLI